MKVSIVVAVYNEVESIKRLLASIEKLELRAGDSLEICLVNDGSTDGTGRAIEEWRNNLHGFRVVYLPLVKNVGRRQAREIGAKAATFENLLITDARCELFPDTLKQLSTINYEPVIGNPIQSQKVPISRVFSLIRRRVFPGSFGDSFADVSISSQNFDKISKGTTIFFVNRERFLKCQTIEVGKNVSDDTGILALIVKDKEILKTAQVKCLYNQRDFWAECRHLFNRGPKFVHYYYQAGRPYFVWLNLSLLLAVLLLWLLAQGFVLPVFEFLIISDIIVGAYFAANLKDFFLLCIYLPPLGLCFFAGLLRGLWLKLFGLY